MTTVKVKKSKGLNGTPSWSYGVSLVIWDHLLKWTHPALTPARQASTQFTYPRWMQGRVNLSDWLHAKMHTQTKAEHSTCWLQVWRHLSSYRISTSYILTHCDQRWSSCGLLKTERQNFSFNMYQSDTASLYWKDISLANSTNICTG